MSSVIGYLGKALNSFSLERPLKVDYTMRESSSSMIDKQLVTVELMGTLGHYVGKRKLKMKTSESLDVTSFIRELEKRRKIPKGLLTEEDSTLRKNFLVLVNGKEISALNGAFTQLEPGDQLILLPVSHGG